MLLPCRRSRVPRRDGTGRVTTFRCFELHAPTLTEPQAGGRRETSGCVAETLPTTHQLPRSPVLTAAPQQKAQSPPKPRARLAQHARHWHGKGSNRRRPRRSFALDSSQLVHAAMALLAAEREALALQEADAAREAAAAAAAAEACEAAAAAAVTAAMAAEAANAAAGRGTPQAARTPAAGEDGVGGSTPPDGMGAQAGASQQRPSPPDAPGSAQTPQCDPHPGMRAASTAAQRAAPPLTGTPLLLEVQQRLAAALQQQGGWPASGGARSVGAADSFDGSGATPTSSRTPSAFTPVEGVPERGFKRPSAPPSRLRRSMGAAAPLAPVTPWAAFTPMEGVPETARGFARPPPPPHFAFTPVEGVPEKAAFGTPWAGLAAARRPEAAAVPLPPFAVSVGPAGTGEPLAGPVWEDYDDDACGRDEPYHWDEEGDQAEGGAAEEGRGAQTLDEREDAGATAAVAAAGEEGSAGPSARAAAAAAADAPGDRRNAQPDAPASDGQQAAPDVGSGGGGDARAAAATPAAAPAARGAAPASTRPARPSVTPPAALQLTPSQQGGGGGGEDARAGGDAGAGPSRPPKRPAATPREVRSMKKRKSLAGDGLTMDSDGLRRSTRTSHKPLEYWRNEHKEYSRNKRSLPTIAAYVERTPDPNWPHPSEHPDRPKARSKRRGGAR